MLDAIPERLRAAAGAGVRTVFFQPIDFPKPLIAAVNGAAAGLGFVNALLCDIRIASERALFTTSFAQRGLAAEHGVPAGLLPQVVGRGHALDLLLSSRRVGADDALRMGLVHLVATADDLLGEAVRYAQRPSSPRTARLRRWPRSRGR